MIKAVSRIDPPGPVAEGDHVTGLVERVTYHSEESGFAVLKVKVRGQRELVTVVGTLPSVSAGEWLDARGRWVIDAQHGRQLRADALRTSRPDTPEGIERYLGSGTVKGIGPHLAGRLVGAFGRDVFRVVEEEPERLREVEGIGPVRQGRIVGAWREQRVVREIMVFLHSHGVSTSRAFRIFKTYGEAAIETVQHDPYRLARDVRGIGFVTADIIAERLGIDRHSELRARAGVEHVLAELTDDGHCAFPRDALLTRAAAMLEIPQPIVADAVEHELSSGRLVAGRDDRGGLLVYLAALHAAEVRVARSLVRLAGGRHPCPPIDVARAVAWVEGRTGITLAPAQRTALELATRAPLLVITGGPGVGKTTLVRSIVAVLLAKGLRVELAAPTGRAAKRLAEATGAGARTIHRLLAVDPSSGRFRHDAEHPLEGDVFIVDETSMIDLPLADHLLRAIPRGAALVLVGDVDQLPSVGPGCVLRDIIASGVAPVCRLTEVFRQAATSAIVTNAHRINRALLPVYPRSRAEATGGDEFFFVEAAEPAHAVELVVRMVKESIPRRFGLDPRDDVQVLTPMQRGELGARNLNLVLQAALNPAGASVQRFGWTFRVGDKVMQLENDYDKEVFNGDIGRIGAIDELARELDVRFDGRAVTYAFDELDELAPAYATTVHKAQGSEYPAVVVPVHTQHYPLLQRNLLYTAVTRGRHLVVLVGTRQALSIAVRRADAGTRITTLARRLVEAAKAARLSVGPREAVDRLPRAAEPEPPYDA